MRTLIKTTRKFLYSPLKISQYLGLPISFSVALGRGICRLDAPLRNYLLRGYL
jgi:hypothetical protein